MNVHRKPDLMWIVFLFVSAGVTLSTLAHAENPLSAAQACAGSSSIQASSKKPSRDFGLWEKMRRLLPGDSDDCRSMADGPGDSAKSNTLGVSLVRHGVRYGRTDGNFHSGLMLTADDGTSGVEPQLWVGVQGRW